MTLRDLQTTPYPFEFNIHSTHSNEAETVESLACESVWVYGQPLYYIERELIDEITGFGEFKTKVVSHAYYFKGFIENVESFEGQQIYSKFGLQFQDSIDLYIPKSFFNNEQVIKTVTPKQQDLIFWSYTDKLFEIEFISDENFQGGHYPLTYNFMYKLSCKLFTFDYSEINEQNILDDITNDTDREKLENLFDLDNEQDTQTNKDIEQENIDYDVIDESEDNPLLR